MARKPSHKVEVPRKGVFWSRRTNFGFFLKFDKKNQKIFLPSIFYQIFIDILIVHKNILIQKVTGWQSHFLPFFSVLNFFKIVIKQNFDINLVGAIEGYTEKLFIAINVLFYNYNSKKY